MNQTQMSSVFLTTIVYLMNQKAPNESKDTSFNYYYLNIGREANASKCFGSYGCFDLSPPWTSQHRPVSLLPENIEKINPNFYLYNEKYKDEPFKFELNDFAPIKSSGMNPRQPVFLLSHGYLEAGNKPWLIEMARALLRRVNCSVIIVDWEGGSAPPYTQAVANIRLVGVMAAHLLADIAKYTANRNLTNVHCIGHSLGSHLCGYAGYTLQKDFKLQLGRITGMDPAEPHFAKQKPPVRLDRSAADFVDIIHTDASAFIRGGLGIIERIGHIDFYPNGGTNQPGCGETMAQYITSESGSFFKGVRQYLGCNHMRSHEYFLESINPECPFMGIVCKSYEDFKQGKCFECGKNGQHCLPLGFDSRKNYNKLIRSGIIKPKDNLILYLMTGDKRPFCRSHYRINAYISNSTESLVHGGEIGQLFFTLHNTTDGRGRRTSKIALNAGGYHAPGASYEAVVSGDSIRNMKSVEVEWKYHSNIFNPLTWRLSTPKLHIANVTVDALETKESIIVCSKNDEPLVSGNPNLLSPAYCMN